MFISALTKRKRLAYAMQNNITSPIGDCFTAATNRLFKQLPGGSQ